MRNSEDIVVSKGLQFSTEGTNSVLIIESAKTKDGGVYNLNAVNRMGKITLKTELVIQSKNKKI